MIKTSRKAVLERPVAQTLLYLYYFFIISLLCYLFFSFSTFLVDLYSGSPRMHCNNHFPPEVIISGVQFSSTLLTISHHEITEPSSETWLPESGDPHRPQHSAQTSFQEPAATCLQHAFLHINQSISPFPLKGG